MPEYRALNKIVRHTHTKLPKHNKRATATITIATAHNKYLANNLGYCVTCGYSTQQTNHSGQNNRFNEYPVKTGYNHIKHYAHTHMIHSLVDFGRRPGPSGSMINVIKLKLVVVCVCKVFQPPMCDQAHPDLVCVFLHMHLSMISQSYGKPLSLQNILHIQFFFRCLVIRPPPTWCTIMILSSKDYFFFRNPGAASLLLLLIA